MELKKTGFDGLYTIKNPISSDPRGIFIKTFNGKIFNELGINTDIKESFYTISKKNVIRGMHFQTPPHGHIKIVYVPAGKILDVVIDLRKDSKTYKKIYSIELSAENGDSLYIPVGFAHGFLSREDNTVVVYMNSTGYAPDNDTGVRWDSINFDWPVTEPVISERDTKFISVDDYNSPF